MDIYGYIYVYYINYIYIYIYTFIFIYIYIIYVIYTIMLFGRLFTYWTLFQEKIFVEKIPIQKIRTFPPSKALCNVHKKG